jgi:hypothetical protein
MIIDGAPRPSSAGSGHQHHARVRRRSFGLTPTFELQARMLKLKLIDQHQGDFFPILMA